MFVGVESGDGGWSEYVLLKNGEPRDGATLVQGDTELGDAICRSTDYKTGQYFRLVISFAPEEGVTPERGREIAKEYIGLMMHGYREDEYHVDIVEHTDTERLHYHVRIPKLNLLTQTQLHYHYLSDIKRKDAIHRYLEAKHDLKSPFEERKLRPDPNKRVEQINRWREEHGQKPFDLSKKKGRGEAEERIADYIQEAVIGGYIDNLEEVQAELKGLGFDIVKVGHDNGKDFDYITIENETGKLRLKGDIYGERFYEHNREDRAEAIRSGKSIERRDASDRPSLAEAEKALERENRKRAKFIQDRYAKARERALSNLTPSLTSDRGRDRDRGEGKEKQKRKTGEGSVRIKREPDGQNKVLGEVENDRIRTEAIGRIREIRTRTSGRKRDAAERIESYTTATEADFASITEARREREFRREIEQSFTAVIQAVTDRVQQLKRSFDNRAKSFAELLKERVVERAKERTMQELNSFKTNINLAEFATAFGYYKDKEKSSLNAPVMRHENGDKVVIGKDKADGHYIYFNPNNDSDNGTIIDFVKNRTSETLGHIRKRLRAWLHNPQPQENIPVKTSTKNALRIANIWSKIKEKKAPLDRHWGVSSMMLKRLQGMRNVKRGDDNSYYFALSNTSGICGIERRTGAGEKHIISGSEKGIFIEGKLKKAKEIIIFESPVDMISYIELNRQKRTADRYYACTMGSIGDSIENSLKTIFSYNKEAKVIVAVDNDAGGDKIAKKIATILKNIDGSLDRAERQKPTMKDWNDDLRERKEQSIEQEGMSI